MTNEAGATKKAHAKGYPARLIGGLLMVLGVVVSAGVGSFTLAAAALFFGGLISLIVGVAQRDTV